MESLSLANRLLADARVYGENNLVGLDSGGDVLHLLHQVFLVPVPPSSVNNHNVRFFLAKMLQAVLGNLLRLLLTRFTINRNLNLRRELLQLFQRARPIRVSTHDAYSQPTFLK